VFVGFFTCRCLFSFRLSSNAVSHTHWSEIYEVKIVLVLKSSTVKTCFSIGGTCPISDT
jgi:hypothetical protein